MNIDSLLANPSSNHNNINLHNSNDNDSPLHPTPTNSNTNPSAADNTTDSGTYENETCNMHNNSTDKNKTYESYLDNPANSINNDSIHNYTNNSTYTNYNNTNSSIDPGDNNALGINNSKSNTSKA